MPQLVDGKKRRLFEQAEQLQRALRTPVPIGPTIQMKLEPKTQRVLSAVEVPPSGLNCRVVAQSSPPPAKVDRRTLPMSDAHKRAISAGHRRRAEAKAAGGASTAATPPRQCPDNAPLSAKELELELEYLIDMAARDGKEEGFKEGWAACAQHFVEVARRIELQAGKPKSKQD